VKKGKVSPPKPHTPQQMSPKTRLDETFERKFRRLLFKMISDLKEDSNKQIKNVRKSRLR
jgi:hypothetical protein